MLDSALPMDGGLSPLRATAFYTMAAKYRIASYHNLRRNAATAPLGVAGCPTKARFWRAWR